MIASGGSGMGEEGIEILRKSGIGEEGVGTVQKLEIASGGAGIGEEGTGIDILIVSNT